MQANAKYNSYLRYKRTSFTERIFYNYHHKRLQKILELKSLFIDDITIPSDSPEVRFL